MPTREQMDEATEFIRETLGAEYAKRGEVVYQFRSHPSGRYVFADHEISRFSELGEARKAHALDHHVHWEGFTRDQQRGVIRRVLDGAGPDTWMDGIAPADPAEALRLRCAEMDAEEQAARLALAGEPNPMTYEPRVAEAYRLRSEVPCQPPSPRSASDEELDRIIDGMVRGWCDQARSESVRGGERSARSPEPGPHGAHPSHSGRVLDGIERSRSRIEAKSRARGDGRDHEPEPER